MDTDISGTDEYKKLELISHHIGRWVSSSSALLCITAFLFVWMMTGFFVHFDDRWNLWMTTPSSAITFFMIFVLARAQTKDTVAIQMKLNEIIAALNGANNNLINVENMSERKVAELSKRYETVAEHLHNQPNDVSSIETIVTHEIVEIEEYARAKTEDQI